MAVVLSGLDGKTCCTLKLEDTINPKREMMMAVNRKELDQMVVVLNNRTGRSYTLDRNIGGYRLMKPMGSGESEVSPRLSAEAMKTWLDGFLEGVSEQRESRQDNGQAAHMIFGG